MIQTGSPMLVDNQRDIKIGYYYNNGDQTTMYYLAAAAEEDVYATTVRKWVTLQCIYMHLYVSIATQLVGGICVSIDTYSLLNNVVIMGIISESS